MFRTIVEELVVGQQRRLARTEIREDQAAAFDARIGELAHLVFVTCCQAVRPAISSTRPFTS